MKGRGGQRGRYVGGRNHGLLRHMKRIRLIRDWPWFFFKRISFWLSESRQDDCDISVIQFKDLPVDIVAMAHGMRFYIVG